MAVNAKDPITGYPIFYDSEGVELGVDQTAIAKFASEVGTRLIGTTAQRDAYPYAREGLKWYNTTTKSEDIHTGTGWRSTGVPYAMASGSGSNATGGTATITFPVGRFTVPPNLSGSTIGNLVRVFHIISVTKDQAVVGGFDFGGNAIAASWHWTAVQMTPTAAAG